MQQVIATLDLSVGGPHAGQYEELVILKLSSKEL